MVRMRTINDAVQELRDMDQNTAITRHFLRQLVIQGKVPLVKAGNKWLVNLDSLLEYLGSNTVEPQVQTGSIRPVI